MKRRLISRWTFGVLIYDLLGVGYHTPPVRLTREFAQGHGESNRRRAPTNRRNSATPGARQPFAAPQRPEPWLGGGSGGRLTPPPLQQIPPIPPMDVLGYTRPTVFDRYRHCKVR